MPNACAKASSKTSALQALAAARGEKTQPKKHQRRAAAHSTYQTSMETAPEGSSSAAEQAAQQLVEVLLPMDATPTLAAHVAPHAAFVSTITERADVVLASALFRELSQAFETLSPLQRFSLYLAMLTQAPETFRRRLEDPISNDEGRWLAAAAPCVAVVVYLRRGAPLYSSSTDQLLEVLDDAEQQSIEDDAATFSSSLYCVCVGLEWLGRTVYDERMEKGLKRDGNILLGYDEDLTASESCVYDFAHVIGGEGFALTKAEIKKHYVVVHVTQCRSGVAWEAVIARAHVLAAEVKRVKSEVHTTTPGLKAAEARARAWPARDVTHLQFEIAEAPRDGFAALACTAKLALEDALAKVDAAKVHVKHVVDGRRKCHLRSCANLESDAAKFLRCARCKDAHYCSRACQEDDWRRLHHKRTCGRCPPSVDK